VRRHRDAAFDQGKYGAVAVRYKIGGAAAIEAAFEKEYP
jgi:hypothetical protein